MALCSGFVEAVKMMRPLGRSWNIGTGWVVSQSQSVRPNRRNGTFECERDKVSVIQKKKKVLDLDLVRRPSYIKIGSP